MLRTQYRCHPVLSKIANQLFYDVRASLRFNVALDCLPSDAYLTTVSPHGRCLGNGAAATGARLTGAVIH